MFREAHTESGFGTTTNYVESMSTGLVHITVCGNQNSDSISKTLRQVNQCRCALECRHVPVNILLDLNGIGNSEEMAVSEMIKWLRNEPFDKLAVTGNGISGQLWVWYAKVLSGKKLEYFSDYEEAMAYLVKAPKTKVEKGSDHVN